VTDMSRGQAFYKTVFGWEFASPPGMPEGTYAMFSKPGTKLAGGMYPIKEGDLIQPKVDSEGKGQATNRITMRVEEVDDALKRIKAAGGAIISGKMNIGPDMGCVGMFRDTEGNINGVWSMK